VRKLGNASFAVVPAIRCIIDTSLLVSHIGQGRSTAYMYPVTEEQIAELVDSFYGKVRDDRMLGPIFAAAIGEDWGPHLAKMRAFWASVMLASGTYKGNPMIAHLNLPRLTREHFERWLDLWRRTTDEICAEPSASVFVQKAEMIAERLLHTISLYHESTVGSR
jgi:hemoglobin